MGHKRYQKHKSASLSLVKVTAVKESGELAAASSAD